MLSTVMDLNHLELPPFMIAGLYRSSLVETGEMTIESPAVIEKTPAPVLPSAVATIGWKYLGENRKNILLVLSYKEAVHLPDEELSFLTGILTACKLSLADIAIVNLGNYPEATYKELTSFFKSKIVLLFAVEPAAFGLPMSFPHFQIQPFANNSFLFSPSLKELENDKLLKSKLWVCLKRLFNL
jgi:hypothetical protein